MIQLNRLNNILARRAYKMADHWAAQYWHRNPLGPEPKADKETYLKLWEEEKARSYPEIDVFEKEAGFAVGMDWFHELALHTQIVVKDSPMCYQHGRVLYSALRHYLDQAKPGKVNIVETGTARGFSSVVMARALADGKTPGQIMTFDLLPHERPMYWNCIDDLDGPKSRAELLSPWKDLVNQNILFVEGDSRVALQKNVMGRIHFAFLDGAHSERDVMLEFSLVVPKQQKGDVIIFDDYSENVFPGLVRAVDSGCAKWGYDKFVLRANDQRAYVVATKT